ncbi:MAG TPA: hypothetical protein VND70_07525 [Acidimicrobiales bacterium]|nr:hypothetical protein [Acidimicrobiales bacterium]
MAGSGGLLGSFALSGASQAASCGSPSGQSTAKGGEGPIYTSGANGAPAVPVSGYAGIGASQGYLQVTGVTSASTTPAVGNVTAAGGVGPATGGIAVGNDGNTNGTIEGQSVPSVDGNYVCTQ